VAANGSGEDAPTGFSASEAEMGSDAQPVLRQGNQDADPYRRVSQHRGAFIGSSFERWRDASENYVASVPPGIKTTLNTGLPAFSTYVNTMHKGIHTVFAESFLGSLSKLRPTSPLNDPGLVTELEIVLTSDGDIAKMGLIGTSGVQAFDIAALDSVQRSSPFGPAPPALLSPDGLVYLHWEFHRDKVDACSTVTPFILGSIMKAPKEGGGTATVIAQDTSPTAIAVDANSVYWSDQAGYIKSVAK